MKATGKQIALLRDLIRKRTPENMEWYNKPIDENDSLAVARRDQNRCDWFGGTLKINRYLAEAAGIGAAEMENLYRKALAVIEQNIESYTTEEASKVIDNLINFRMLPFVEGLIDPKLLRR